MNIKQEIWEVDTTANREHKDTVFTLLVGNQEKAVEIYNAIHGTDYKPEDVEMTTLTNVLYRGRVNDVSFILDGKLVVLFEHQSTINRNMPIRMLLYYAVICDHRIDGKKLYDKKSVPLPRPEFIVLYNGKEEIPDEMELKLSDMYIKDDRFKDDPVMLELVVKVYNINKGRNPQLAERSPTLDGYETFIDLIRQYEKSMSLEDAIKRAVHDCMDKDILKEFFNNHKQECVKMLLTEWTLEDEIAVVREAAREEAWEEGREAAMRRAAYIMKVEGYDSDSIAKITGLSPDVVRDL